MMVMHRGQWSVAEAKARLSELLERARSAGPQTITRNGRETAVVVSVEEWKRRTERRGTLADFLNASPLPGSGLSLRRPKHRGRKLSL